MLTSVTRNKKIGTAKAKHAASSVSKKAARISENMADMANEAGQQAREFIDSAAANINEAKESVVERIQEKPIQSSLIALGAGFVLGIFFRRS
ncbi:MAG: hypothetical protein EB060_04530 [Proteobacteria bacterium]|nr:hypothetical protein [Pseudomonadota bacterium]